MNIAKKIITKRNIFFMLAWFIAVSAALHVRLYPITNYASSKSHEQATMIVLSRLRKKAVNQIQKRFPSLPEIQRNKLIKKTFDQTLSKESKNVQKSIRKLSKNLDRASHISKTPHLLGSDSYYYFDLTKRIHKTGNLSKEIKGSKYFNNLMLAPTGHWEPLNLHPFVGYAIYRTLRIFDPATDITFAVSITPLLITVIALTIYMGICRVIKCSLLESLLGALYFSLAPIFVKRSAFGWYDNDPYNALFPLLILFVFFVALKHINERKKTIIFSMITALLFVLYSFFWHGWMYLFAAVIISICVISAYDYYLHRSKKNVKNYAVYIGVIACVTFVGISIAFGAKDFFALFAEGWQALKNFLSPQLSPWPDIFISVGELKQTSLHSIIEKTGGPFFFYVSLIGLLLGTYNTIFRRDGAPAHVIITAGILFFFSLLLSFGALRFILLALIPLSILFVLGIKYICSYIRMCITLFIPVTFKKDAVYKISIAILLLFASLIPIKNAHQTLSNFGPIFNDTWSEVLVDIKNKTAPDSIVNSWWPPGHFIKATAQRRVVFDGATINTPQAYWMAHILLSSDEKYAVGLLRMLNNSGNESVNFLQKQGMSLPAAVAKLKEITTLNKQKANSALTGSLDAKKTENLLRLSHGYPPDAYMLIYNELADKNLQFGLIGRWNFDYINNLRSDPQKVKNLPDSNTKAYIKFLWETVGGPLAYSGTLAELGQQKNLVFFEQNVRIDLNDFSCYIDSTKFGKGVPKSIFYLDKNDILVEKDMKNATLGYSVLLSKKDNQYLCILLDKKLAQSILIRLYFFDGKGMRYFEPFVHKKDLTGRTNIYVYKINWKKFFSDIREVGE